MIILILLTWPIALPIIGLKYFWKHAKLGKQTKVVLSIVLTVAYLGVLGLIANGNEPTAEERLAKEKQQAELGAQMQAEKDAKAEVITETPEPSTNLRAGQEGYLRLPGITDKTQVICLGRTKDDADAISKSLLAKDYLGILEIPEAFCVGNGTKILFLERSLLLSRVRILQGVNEVDQDKFGLSGWLPFEWVVDR